MRASHSWEYGSGCFLFEIFGHLVVDQICVHHEKRRRQKCPARFVIAAENALRHERSSRPGR